MRSTQRIVYSDEHSDRIWAKLNCPPSLWKTFYVVAYVWKGYVWYLDELGRAKGLFHLCGTSPVTVWYKIQSKASKGNVVRQQIYLFFESATPVVQEFERLEQPFSANQDTHELHQQIFLHQKSLQYRLYDAKRLKKKKSWSWFWCQILNSM